MSRTGTVYVLIDPRGDRVRYVGATKQTLKARLGGHVNSPTPRIKAWVNELAFHGLSPRIEPVTEGVPAADLREAERAEITRRLIAGESLLNESATAPARRRVEQLRRQEQAEHERAAWEHVANQVRAIVGGPLPPGDLQPIELDRRSVETYHTMMQLLDGADHEAGPDKDRRVSRETRFLMAQARAGDALWQSVQGAWSHLLRRAGNKFEEALARGVGAVFSERWADLCEAPQYLALLPWALIVVSPWAALADRAGMDMSAEAFIDWVTDNPAVRDALTILLVRAGGRTGSLTLPDAFESTLRPSIGLVAMTAAHCPRLDVPQELHGETVRFLEAVLKNGQLTPAMANLLLELDPGALDRLLGPEITAVIDVDLGLPPGTSKDVMEAVLQRFRGRDLDTLASLVDRANGAFPTVAAPDLRSLHGDTVPIFQTIVASLTAAGLLTETPDGMTPAKLLGEVRRLWCVSPRWLARAA